MKLLPNHLKNINGQTALLLGIAAGFAFLIGLGAGYGVLTSEIIVMASFVAITIVAIALLQGRK